MSEWDWLPGSLIQTRCLQRTHTCTLHNFSKLLPIRAINYSPVRPDECVASFPGPHPAFHNPGNKEAGECEHVLGVSTCLVSTVVDCICIKMVDNTNVKLKRAGNVEE